jgi:PAT family beta-lactamase induction signal transducer AmpG
MSFVLPAVIAGIWLGEPKRHREPIRSKNFRAMLAAVVEPLTEFFHRRGAWLVLAFVLLHKIGDTLANLTLRLLLDDLNFSNAEIAQYDVGFGFIAYLIGIFLGGMLYTRIGLKRAVLTSLILMAVSNLSFAALAAYGHSNALLAFTICFENVASGIGGVAVVAYLSALCNLSFTATQFALLSAAASVVGRFMTGTTAGALIEGMGYVSFYLLTTLVALPGVALFAWMMRAGLIDSSVGDAASSKR